MDRSNLNINRLNLNTDNSTPPPTYDEAQAGEERHQSITLFQDLRSQGFSSMQIKRICDYTVTLTGLEPASPGGEAAITAAKFLDLLANAKGCRTEGLKSNYYDMTLPEFFDNYFIMCRLPNFLKYEDAKCICMAGGLTKVNVGHIECDNPSTEMRISVLFRSLACSNHKLTLRGLMEKLERELG